MAECDGNPRRRRLLRKRRSGSIRHTGERMALIVVGVNHRTAPLELRERLVYRPAEVHALLDKWREADVIREGVLLSTCNRVELYAVEGNGDAAGAVWQEFSERAKALALDIGYTHRDRAVVAPLVRVAAGLDCRAAGE